MFFRKILLFLFISIILVKIGMEYKNRGKLIITGSEMVSNGEAVTKIKDKQTGILVLEKRKAAAANIPSDFIVVEDAPDTGKTVDTGVITTSSSGIEMVSNGEAVTKIKDKQTGILVLEKRKAAVANIPSDFIVVEDAPDTGKTVDTGVITTSSSGIEMVSNGEVVTKIKDKQTGILVLEKKK